MATFVRCEMCYQCDTTSVGDICRVGTLTTTTATDFHERIAELFRRPVVDDWVDTRVEVRQAVPHHAHRLQR